MVTEQSLRAGESGGLDGFITSNPTGTNGRGQFEPGEALASPGFLVCLGGDTSQKSLKKSYWNCASGAELDSGYSDLATEEAGTPQTSRRADF